MDRDTERFDSSRFKPMTEGLGLNHFADGLPYTPVSQRKPKPMVHFNFPPPRAPRASTEANTQPSVENTLATQMHIEQELAKDQNAGFVRRMFAFGLDITFSASMFALIVWASFTLNGFD